ncbi:MAG TPA: FxsA family protein [Methylophilus sp.]
MRFFIFAILLAFPIMEIAVLIELCDRYGWWVLAYLILIGYLGLRLIRSEKDLIAARMFQQLGAGGHPVGALLSTARNMFAGVLLLIPGVITDVIAVVLLLMPAGQKAAGTPGQQGFRYQDSANDEVIEGEFTEVHDAPARDNVVHLPRKD